MPILGSNSSGGSRSSAPVIGSATDGGTGTTASVAFTPSTYIGKGTITYTATSSPGSITATSSSSPITVSGLTTGTSYTFTVQGTTNYGVTSAVSSASNSVTPAVPTSFESIATATGTGSSNIITFSSIPSTYKSLQIRITGKRTNTTGGYSNISVKVNGDEGTNYGEHTLYGDGSSTGSGNTTSNGSAKMAFVIPPSSGATSNMQGVAIIDITDYASTSKKKTFRSMSGGTFNGAIGGAIYLSSAHWMSTTALNSISFTAGSGNFTTTTTFALYGMK